MSADRPTSTMRLTMPYVPVAAGLFCIQLDFFSLNLALPVIADHFATPVTDVQWLLSGYMMALGSLLIPAGRLGEMYGRRLMLQIGISVFGLSSLVCGLASNTSMLIAARVTQGVGAALIFPTGFAVVTNSTTDSVRPRIVGALLGIAGVGTALGPVVGGLFAASVGWRWVFLINVPVAAYAVWQCRRLPNSRDDAADRALARIDWWGVLTVVGGLVLLSAAIDDISVQGITDPATYLPLLGGLMLLGAFAFVETRVPQPLVPRGLVRNSVFVVLTLASTIANIGAAVYIVGATLELQDVRGYGSASAGLLFCVSSIGLAACGPLSAKLSVRFHPALIMAGVLLLSAPSLVLLALAGPIWLYVLALACAGITTGMGYALGQLAVQNVLPPQQSAAGTSVLLTVMISVGGMGVVAGSAVIEAVGGGTPQEGIRVTLLLLAAVLLLAGVVTLFAARGMQARAPEPAAFSA